MLPWPLYLNFSNIDGITGFGVEDSQLVLKFMLSAVELGKSKDGLVSVQFCLFHLTFAYKILHLYLIVEA